MARGLIEVGLVFILGMMMIVLFFIVLTAASKTVFNPHEQAAFASVQALALAIDEVCGKATNNSETLNVNFPQPTPPVILGSTIFSQISMRVNGDPHYLIYYENFPPGEGITWEIYNDYPVRGVVFADPAAGETLGEYLARFRQEMQDTGLSSDMSRYAFGNIILRDRQLGGEPQLTGDAGRWDGDFYEFDLRTPTTATLEHSQAKYRACGDFALCFKTRKGIIRIPLEQCKRTGIRTMQVGREPPAHPEGLEEYAEKTVIGAAAGAGAGAIIGAIATIWTGPGALAGAAIGAKIGAWVGAFSGAIFQFVTGNALIDQTSDFYLGSPCKAEATIKRTQCECRNPHAIPVLAKDEFTSREYGVYGVNGDTFGQLKAKNLCVHQYLRDETLTNRSLGQECVKVTLEGVSGFCTGGQNELGQVTLSTLWDDEFQSGVAFMGGTKELRKLFTVGEEAGVIQRRLGALRIPWGWPKG